MFEKRCTFRQLTIKEIRFMFLCGLLIFSYCLHCMQKQENYVWKLLCQRVCSDTYFSSFSFSSLRVEGAQYHSSWACSIPSFSQPATPVKKFFCLHYKLYRRQGAGKRDEQWDCRGCCRGVWGGCFPPGVCLFWLNPPETSMLVWCAQASFHFQSIVELD